jgi:hypothetical protein
MPKSSDVRKWVKEWVRSLVKEYHYLPLGEVVDLERIKELGERKLCRSVEDVKKRAIEVLVAESEEAEIYRQLIFILSFQNVIKGLNPYLMARVAARALREPSKAYEELHDFMVEKKGEYRKSGYKEAVRVYADLIQLNFAYGAQRVVDSFFEHWKKPTQDKVLASTIQSSSFIDRLPLRPFESTRIDEELARDVVDFSVELRRRVVEAFLKLRPRKSCDIFNYIYEWAKREVERRRVPIHMKEQLGRYIYIEVFNAPYYLHHYGFIKIDPVKYQLYWEIE